LAPQNRPAPATVHEATIKSSTPTVAIADNAMPGPACRRKPGATSRSETAPLHPAKGRLVGQRIGERSAANLRERLEALGASELEL